MKKVLVLLFILVSLLLVGCPKHPETKSSPIPPKSIEDIPTNLIPSAKDYNKPNPVQDLIDYNVILLKEADIDAGICGGTVLYSSSIGSLILTASHCVIDDDDHVVDHLFIDSDDGDFYRVEVIKFNRADDLALLMTTDRAPKLTAAPLAIAPPAVGETIWVVGYGARIKDIVSKGIVAKTQGSWEEKAFLVDCTGWYGNSGGGVFNEDGELVGVVVRFGPQFRGHGPETGWMWATSWDAIIDLLRK